jgi:hypothetical protein
VVGYEPTLRRQTPLATILLSATAQHLMRASRTGCEETAT